MMSDDRHRSGHRSCVRAWMAMLLLSALPVTPLQADQSSITASPFPVAALGVTVIALLLVIWRLHRQVRIHVNRLEQTTSENAKAFSSLQNAHQYLSVEHEALLGLYKGIIWHMDRNGNVSFISRNSQETASDHSVTENALRVHDLFGATSASVIDAWLQKLNDDGHMSDDVTLFTRCIGSDDIRQYAVSAAAVQHPTEGFFYWFCAAEDVTELLRLQQNAITTQAMLDQSEELIALLSADGVLKYVNAAAAERLGYQANELIGRDALELIDPSDQRRALELMARVNRRQDTRINATLRVRRADCSLCYIAMNATVLDKHAPPQTIMIHGRDTTDLAEIRDALRDSTASLGATLQATGEGIIAATVTGRILFLNDQFASMWNLPEHVRSNKNNLHVIRYVLPQLLNPSGFLDLLRQVGLTSDKRTDIIAFKDGRRVEFDTYPLLEHDDTLIGRIWAFRDVTDRVLAEEALRHSEHLLQVSQQLAQVGSWVMDHSTRYLYWTEQTYRLFGIERNQFNNTYEAFLSLVHPDDADAVDDAFTRSLLDPVKSYQIVHRVIRYDTGEVRYLAETGVHIVDDQGKLLRSIGVAQDITERHRHSEVLAARLRLHQQAASDTLDGFLTDVLDEVERFTESRVAYYHFIDEQNRQVKLQSWSTNTLQSCEVPAYDRQYPLDRAGVWTECLQERRPVIHNDYRNLPHKKGLPRGHTPIIRTLSVPIIRNDRVVGILGIGNSPRDYTQADAELVAQFADFAWDIADRIQTEQQLAAQLQRTQALLAAIPDLVFILSPDGRFVDHKADDVGLLYAPPADFMGRAIDDVLPLDVAQLTHRNMDVAKRTGLTQTYTYQLHVGDELKTFEARLAPCNNGTCLAIVRDITDRVQEAYERERLTAAIDQAGEAILITDINGVITYANPAVYATSGYSHADVIGHTPSIFRSGETPNEVYQQLWNTILSGNTWKGRLVNHRRDGSLYTEDVTISPVRDSNQAITHFVAVKRDITAELQMEERYQHAQRLESVGRLAGGVAHDFNNMLGAIIGYADLALKRSDPSNPLYARMVSILNTARRSADLTRQLLAFARKSSITPQVIDLNTTIEGMMSMLRRLIGEDISLTWNPEAGLWPVKIDPSQVDQVLANLCINARDAITGPGQITIATHNTSLSSSSPLCVDVEPGDYVVLCVTDSGCGMDAETQQRIFEPFFTTKESGKGTGLGLPTVHGIVRQNNGTIVVDSEPGKGSRFCVYLPRCLESGEEQITSPDEVRQGKGETILLVEDEPEILQVTRSMLESIGYQVLATGSPAEAIQLASREDAQIDLLLTDVVMPDMNGRALAFEIQQRRPDLRVLYMSGYTADVIARHGTLEPGIELLEKPFTLVSLSNKILQVLSQPLQNGKDGRQR